MSRLALFARRAVPLAFLLPLFLRSCTVIPAYAERAILAVPSPAAVTRGTLRVAADPDHMPFSNDHLEGFENRLAELIAQSLHTSVEYVWQTQNPGFASDAFGGDRCDVVIGVPEGFEPALTTKPYYRSTYVFVTRRNRHLNLRSFDDRRLPRLEVGVSLPADDGAQSPAVYALARHGIVDGVRGYSVHDDVSGRDASSRLIRDVSSGALDAAIVWGPTAGWRARHSKPRLRISPLAHTTDAGIPFTFAIAVGVRRDRPRLRDAIDAVLVEHRKEIERLLDDYGVPRVSEPKPDRHTR